MQPKKVQSFYDCLLSDDELFASDEEEEKEVYLSCFMASSITGEDNSGSDAAMEKNEEELFESDKRKRRDTY